MGTSGWLRLFIPFGLYQVKPVRAILIWGGNGGGYTGSIHEESHIREWLRRNNCAVVGYLSGKGVVPNDYLPHLRELARQSGHPEVEHAPWMIRGFSRAGMVSYNVARLLPGRVVAFSWNSGHPLQSGDPPDGTFFPDYVETFRDFYVVTPGVAEVPGLFINGQRDTYRMRSTDYIFSRGRAMKAPWGLAVEPGIGHVVGHAEELDLPFFEKILQLRLPPGQDAASGPVLLRDVDLGVGWIGDRSTLEAHAFQPEDATDKNSSWLVDESFARYWSRFVRGQFPVAEP